MKVNVLSVKQTKTVRIAHVQAGDLFGDVLATPDVTGPGEYELKVTLRSTAGKLVALVRVEK